MRSLPPFCHGGSRSDIRYMQLRCEEILGDLFMYILYVYPTCIIFTTLFRSLYTPKNAVSAASISIQEETISKDQPLLPPQTSRIRSVILDDRDLCQTQVEQITIGAILRENR